ncbi:MAG: YggS family pyridoxal phosphate-dependent enzyme [Oscillospiraceae bacterium]|nr:YggS family pyridoxal phosphate-dependent enzyme [Oscillospiraceae bacterium]
MASMEERVLAIQQRIREAECESGRASGSVTLVAASKMNDAAAVRAAYAAGIRCFGENRVQELVDKRTQGAYEGARLHLIGHLQKNKVKFVAGQVDLIESVDSLALMEAIEKRCAAQGTTQDVLLEVNLAGEASKTGMPLSQLPAILEEAGRFSCVQVKGLMGIPPAGAKSAENRAYFARMHELFVDIRGKKYDNVSMAELSMGMSGDFEDAIREGSTMVRIGTAIFGARDYGLF